MKALTFNERRQSQLEILKVVDEFCRKNNIKYSLAYGTLIGAIRHNGFIPWDDDIDIMMTYDNLIKLKKLFNVEGYKYLDVDTHRNYEYGFSRICNTSTFSKVGWFSKIYGVCIDVYPIIGLPNNEEIQPFFDICNIKLKHRLRFLKWRGRILKYLHIDILNYSNIVMNFRNYLFKYADSQSEKVLVYGGGIRTHNVFDKSDFEEYIEKDFEGDNFYIPKKYNEILTHIYGDYMQLPPEDKRHPTHGGNYYWKEIK